MLLYKKCEIKIPLSKAFHFYIFISFSGKWLDQGCKKVKEKNNHVICECDHLTSFAILIDVTQTHQNPLELQIITWIGCGISIAGLLLTLITYGFFK
jgi:Latrophilin/CL-1-like GPS domain.